MRSFSKNSWLEDAQENAQQFKGANVSKALLGSIGLAGEVGECTEPVKKWFFHGSKETKEVKEKLREEIGDVLWYAACLADAFGLSLDEIAAGNIEKLLRRYPERK